MKLPNERQLTTGREEFAIERLWRSVTPQVSELGAAAKRAARRSLPESDGGQGIADPQLISLVLLGVLTLLMAIKVFDDYRSRTLGARRPKMRQRARALLSKVRSVRRKPKSIDFAAARASLERRLSQMVGLVNIKAHLSTLLDTLEIDQRRSSTQPGFATQRGCLHMVFLGSPGTGKTAVAQLIAVLFRDMGLLPRGHLVVAKKADFLGRFSNHVARNTAAVVKSALGGVLLIGNRRRVRRVSVTCRCVPLHGGPPVTVAGFVKPPPAAPPASPLPRSPHRLARVALPASACRCLLHA